ncbi:hypothetical protein JO972_16590 [Verrucomicrobiaceae bacterium 5K15]|nr:hypothetical protein [Oceaniferula flavus]
MSQICKDWIRIFPNLVRYKSGRKLLRGAETVIYGIEIRKISDDVYRPEFICLNLLSAFNEFSLVREFDLPKNPQADVPFADHAQYYPVVARRIKEEVPLLSKVEPLQEDIVCTYRSSIDCDLFRGSNPLSLMTSLIQQAIYYGLSDVESTERTRLKQYMDSLSPSVIDCLRDPIAKELSASRDDLIHNLKVNMSMSCWPGH